MDMDGNLKKLGKRFQFYIIVNAMPTKITKKILWVSAPRWNSFDNFLIILQEHFVYG